MNETSEFDVIIIGAGLAGLTAAKKCEDSGLSVLLLDSGWRVGGRVQVDVIKGFRLERGFQVLIDSYEKARELLDFDALELKRFGAGAQIFDARGSYVVADPLRKPSRILGTVFSKVGSLNDKVKMLTLVKSLQNDPLDSAFNGERQTTENFFNEYGFSEKIVENFLRPFFGGIFLERKLETDAAMFRFVFRNFSNGNACIPAKGMQQIPMQLKAKLKSTEVRLNTSVKKVNQDASIELEDGSALNAKKIIVAGSPSGLLPQLDQPLSWKSTTTVYLSGAKELPEMDKLIGLDTRSGSSINNFARHDEVVPESAPMDKSLWSVTVRENQSDDQVKSDLAGLLKVGADKLEVLKRYDISRALPIVDRPTLTVPPEQTQVTEHVHLAGDYLTNSSIDGAMRSGEAAAMAVAETLKLIH